MISLFAITPVKAGFSEMLSTLMTSVSYTVIAANAGYIVSQHWLGAVNLWATYRNSVSIERVGQSVAAVNNRVGQAHTKLDDLSILAQDTRQAVHAVRTELKIDMVKVNDQLGEQSRTLGTLVDTTTGIRADVAQVSANVEGLRNEFGEFRAEVRSGLSKQREQFDVIQGLLGTLVDRSGSSADAVAQQVARARDRLRDAGQHDQSGSSLHVTVTAEEDVSSFSSSSSSSSSSASASSASASAVAHKPAQPSPFYASNDGRIISRHFLAQSQQ